MPSAATLLAVILTLVSILLPTSTAQYTQPPAISVEVRFDDPGPDNLLAPETEVASGVILVRVELPVGSFCLQGFDVALAIKEQPTYATTVIEEPRLRVASTQPGIVPSSHTVHSRVTVAVTRDAPAFQDGIYKFEARIIAAGLAGGCLLSPASAWGVGLIKNGYQPGISLGTITQWNEGLGGWIDIPLENRANGPTRVQATAQPADPTAFLAIHGKDQVLESRADQGESAAIHDVLRLRYQLAHPGLHALTVTIVASAAYGNARSDIQVLELFAMGDAQETEGRNAGAAEPPEFPNVPGPGLLTTLLVAAGGLVAARRGRGR
jgi:hypothetical protein